MAPIDGSDLVIHGAWASEYGAVRVISDCVLTAGPPTVIQVAAANPALTTLVAAIIQSGLVDTLARTGPFTVFAPTNSAFDALPAGTLDALLADIPALTNVLLYHVTSGLNFVKSFSDQQDVPTLQGSVITIDLSIGTQIVFDTGVATVTSADVSASNGLVQIIDTVLIPPVGSTPPPGIAPESGSAPVPTVAGPTPGFAIAPVPTVFIGPTPRPVQAPVETVTGSVVDVAAANTDLSTLVRAINVASLVDTLSAVGPFTVFAPTNAAFDFLPAGTLDDLLADIPSLTNVLLYHVTSGVNFVKSFTDQQDVLTLQGSIFTIDLSIGTQIVFDTGVATVTSADVSASNGLIQIIDTVLIPPVGSTPPPGIVPESGSAPVPTVVAGPTPGPVQIPAPTVVAGPTPRPVQAPLGSVGGTVVQVAAANPDLTTLVAAIIDAGLDDTLARTGPFTVFAPTNSAFDSLPTGTLDALLADIPSLTNVLLYHVVSGVNFVKSFTDQQDVLTLQGSVITIDLSIGTQVVFDTGVATVTAADIAASNGLIQIIDTVLIPPTGPTPPPGPVMSNGTSTPTGVGIIGPAVPTPGGAPKPTGLTGGIVSIAGATVDLTTFVAAVDAAGLEDALSAFPLTVFAPVDTAFAALPNGTLDGLLADIPALTDVLLYHVIGQRLFAADFGAGIVFPTLQGSTLSTGSTLTSGASTVAQVIYAGGTANVLVADVLASNGLLHTIDTVMIPPSRGAVEAGSIVDVVGAVASLTTLVSAIEAAGLVDILSGAGSYTLFAPNDGAFESLSIDLLADEAELERILLSHVVAREFLSTDVVDGLIVSTVAGGTLTMHLGTDAVEIQGAIGVATVLTPDIAASNGVVHVIDTVLMPPTPAPALSPVPTLTPAASPSGTPSASPSVAPTSIPTPLVPTEAPTSQPTPMPSPIPTPPPTSRPTPMPSPIPTPPPTSLPTPTTLPTPAPTTPPTRSPSRSPTTWVPTVEPTVTPTTTPSTSTPTVATIRSVTAYRSCFGKGCPLDVLFERLDQADLIVAASLKVEFKGDFGSDSREFVTVDLNGAQVVQGHRPQKWYSECMDDFETCAEFDDVLDLVKNGDIRVQMWASPFVDHPCSDDIFKSKYMMGARFTLTFECPVAADNSEGNAGCFGSLPPSMSPGPTLSPVPTSTLPSPVPTVLSSIGSLIGEGWCSFAGCEVSASFGRLENPGDIIKATLNVDVRGEFSETNEFADLYLNDVKYSNKCGTIDCSDTLDPCTPTEIDVLPIVRGPQGDLVANLKASPAVGDTFLCANENPNYAMRARFTLTFVCSSGVARKDGCYSSSSSPPLKPTTTLPTPAPSVVPTA